MEPLHYQPLTSVAAAVRAGTHSARELTELMLRRIADRDQTLRSYATVLGDRAQRSAEMLDEEARAGRWRGPLHGVPIAVKDLFEVTDTITASGTRVMSSHRSSVTATVVRRLEQAGAVIIGKTQLTEGAFAVHHPMIPAPLNPWNHDCWPGVSSSGSGVAVAAGLAWGALGTDTGGSIRFPSASCGLVGLKPTYGRVSRHGAFPLADSLDHIGPMTRTVADAAVMLGTMAGADPRDPTTLRDPVPDYRGALDQSIEGLTIGIDWEYAEEGVAQSVKAAVRRAVDLLSARGARIVDISMPSLWRELVAGWNITCGVECARAHAPFFPARRAEYGPVLAALLDLGRRSTSDDYARLEQHRGAFRAALTALFSRVDLLLMPNMPWLPLRAKEMDAATGAAPADSNGNVEIRAAATTFTAPFNYSGHPTLTLPIGISPEGLPLTVQFVGPWLGEARLLQVGHSLVEESGFRAHPPV
ncbi:MAG: amidase [Pseudomonadales bacterium]